MGLARGTDYRASVAVRGPLLRGEFMSRKAFLLLAHAFANDDDRWQDDDARRENLLCRDARCTDARCLFLGAALLTCCDKGG